MLAGKHINSSTAKVSTYAGCALPRADVALRGHNYVMFRPSRDVVRPACVFMTACRSHLQFCKGMAVWLGHYLPLC